MQRMRIVLCRVWRRHNLVGHDVERAMVFDDLVCGLPRISGRLVFVFLDCGHEILLRIGMRSVDFRLDSLHSWVFSTNIERMFTHTRDWQPSPAQWAELWEYDDEITEFVPSFDGPPNSAAAAV